MAKGSKSKKKTKKTTETDEIDENLSFLLEASDFCVAISKSKPEFSEWSGTVLYSFHIELLGGVKIDLSASDLWIYLSHVPDINFVYIDNKHYQKIANISKLNYQLLKAFEHGIHGIGMKRRNIILVPGEIQGKRMEINIEVHESTLFKFNHPSDVVAKVPQSGSRHSPDAPIPIRQRRGATRLSQMRQCGRCAASASFFLRSLPILLTCCGFLKFGLKPQFLL